MLRNLVWIVPNRKQKNKIEMFLQKVEITARKTNPTISNQKLKRENNYKETEREVNSKILKISLKINAEYPELSKYLEQMPVTFPIRNKPEITLKGLSTYYDSLNVLLSYHIKSNLIKSTC